MWSTTWLMNLSSPARPAISIAFTKWRAEAAAMELKQSLSTSDFLQGLRFIADGNGNNALAFLVRSLTANPTNDAALAGLTAWLTYHSWMAPTLILKHGEPVLCAEFSP